MDKFLIFLKIYVFVFADKIESLQTIYAISNAHGVNLSPLAQAFTYPITIFIMSSTAKATLASP